jgi:hypothetical protein
MTGFSADWLALRAAADADARARDKGLAARLGGYFASCGEVRVLDLGAGTGANMRATAPLIAAPQHWVLADNDAALLARAEPVANITVERRDRLGVFRPVRRGLDRPACGAGGGLRGCVLHGPDL